MLKILRNILILPVLISFCLLYTAAAAPDVTSDLDDDTLYLAATLWGETRGDYQGIQVVASTIMNRKKYYESQNGNKPVSIKSIISDTDQYASWKGKSWDTAAIIKEMAEYQGSDKAAWESCINYAKVALNGYLSDVTNGSMTYPTAADPEAPAWARGTSSTTTIGDNVVVRGASTSELADSNGSGTGSASAFKTSAPASDSSSGTASSCNGVESVSRDISPSTNSGYGVISDKTMQNMSNMLDRIYKNLGRVFMLGHGILCYATKVAYSCFGIDIKGVASACWITAPDLSFFICGLAIYITAFLMSVAIGMYFIDICFKLGFAIMYLPVAIALWPFAPTKSKFGEAFGMILHNSMLYAMMSIGLTYAIVLIYNGILGDSSHWSSFWTAIEQESSEKLAENFSLSSTRIIVIMFCLIFGFKIIASSVNDYLDYFFSDGLMGGQSPMHYLGTQAIGMTAGATAGRLTGYVSDVASTQAGRGVEAIGNTLVDMSKGDFGIVGKAAKSIAKPFAQFQTGLKRMESGDYTDTVNASLTGTGGATGATRSAPAPTENLTIGDIASDINKATTPDETTLRPKNILKRAGSAIGDGIKTTANSILHPQITYRTLKQIATEGMSDDNSPYQNGKLILTNTGKVMFRKLTPEGLREGLDSDNSFAQNAGILAMNTLKEGGKTVRATVSDVTEKTGNILIKRGRNMKDNSKREHTKNFYAGMQSRREIEEEEKRIENLVNRTDSDQHENNEG